MRIHHVEPAEDFDNFLQTEAGYHSWKIYDYIEPKFIAEISTGDADFLSEAGAEVYRMCLAAVDKVIRENRFKDFGIGELQARHITASWSRRDAAGDVRRDPELYGRFDFCWDGARSLKFYEINADTPTTSYECAVVQWIVLQDLIKREQVAPDASQFNQLEEHIIEQMAHFRVIAAEKNIDTLHFSAMTDWKEDLTTTSYLEALAQKAGWKTKFVDIGLVGVNENADGPAYGMFFDDEHEEIKAFYKLMPWEHIYEFPYAKYVEMDKIPYIEPPWKAILSNKMLSVVLWEMYPDHPYLLPAYKTPEKFNGTYVEKPIFGRISAGIKVIENNLITSVKQFDPDEPAGAYGSYPKIYQQFCPLPEMPGLPGWRYLTGIWVVGDGKIAGMDLRIDKTLVTGAGSIRFLPHFMRDKEL